MWTENNETEQERLAKERENNKKEIGKLHTISMLKKMITALEEGTDVPFEIDIEYIHGDRHFAYQGEAPVIGKKITLIYH